MALHKLVLVDMELTALIMHLEGQNEIMCESRLNSSNQENYQIGWKCY